MPSTAKKILAVLLCLGCLIATAGCNQVAPETTTAPPETTTPETTAPVQSQEYPEGTVWIQLSDSGITVDGAPASTQEEDPVYIAHDIVYYESGQDFTYGAGSEADAHDPEEAAKHTVIHISQAGTYRISGQLSAGQIAVDLGKKAKTDPDAVVNLILDGVDLTCTVAPAIIFYKVYECDQAWVDFDDNETEGYQATWDVDTSHAGANIILANSTESTVTGSYVAKIYKPESVELNADGTAVESAKKLHKYDGAVYSKRSMTISGGGKLTINADNEGLDSELHLTMNSGDVVINAGNDGINTNEDNVSVTTVNGGNLTVIVTGETGEGDGIDSNGWLVINGGTVTAYACSSSMDSGIDSDMGIYINGGTVVATGNMYDQIDGEAQNYVVFQFAKRQTGGRSYTLKNANGEAIGQWAPANDFQYLVFSAPELAAGDYTLWQGDTQLSGQTSTGFGGMGPGSSFGGQEPGGNGQDPGSSFGGQEPGEDIPQSGGNFGGRPDSDVPTPSDAATQPPAEPFGQGDQIPGGDTQDPGSSFGGDQEPPEGFDGQMPDMGEPNMGGQSSGEELTIFPIAQGGNFFTNIG